MGEVGPNAAVAKQLYDAFLKNDTEAIYALLDPEVEWELVGPEEVPHFGRYRGVEDVKRFFGLLAENLQVDTFEVHSYTETANGCYAEGLERGHFPGHAKPFEMRWCHLFRVENGRITSFRDYHDTSPMVDAWRS